MYLLEMHCHCAPVSLCASITPEEEIAKYKAAGYSGIVSTHHIDRSTFRDMEEKTWEEKTAYFLSAYEKLCRCGREADIDVLLACEINLTPKGWPEYIPNDYLVYGIYHGVLLSTCEVFQRKSSFYKKHRKDRWFRVCSWAITMLAVFYGFALFGGQALHPIVMG